MKSARPPALLAPFPEEPLRAVEARDVLPRRRAFVVVLRLACGHTIWRYAAREPVQPPRPVRCTTCWLEEIYSPARQ